MNRAEILRSVPWPGHKALLLSFERRFEDFFSSSHKHPFISFSGTSKNIVTNERNIANLWEGIILFCHSGQFLALRFRPHFALRFLAFVVQCLLGTLTGLDGPVLLHGSTCGTLWDPVLPGFYS